MDNRSSKRSTTHEPGGTSASAGRRAPAKVAVPGRAQCQGTARAKPAAVVVYQAAR